MLSAEDMAWLEKGAEDVKAGKERASRIARLAVSRGFLLIGCKKSKTFHYPTNNTKTHYYDMKEKFWQTHNFASPKILQAGGVADVAIAAAIWGDVNNVRERAQVSRQIMGKRYNAARHNLAEYYWAWANDPDATRREPPTFQALDDNGRLIAWNVFPQEESLVKLFAQPPYIVAARNSERPLTGVIDMIMRDDSFTRVPTGAAAQYVSTVRHKTVLSLPIRSNIDLPLRVETALPAGSVLFTA